MKVILFPLLLLSLAGSLWGITGDEIRDGEVAVQLVTPFASVEPGQKIPVGIRFEIDEGWHIYWRNPGDTGLPPEVKWDLPENSAPSDFRWPYPEIYRNAHLVDFTYSGTVTLYSEITVPEDWPAGKDFSISAAVDWLMCAEICIPGAAQISLDIPVSPQAETDDSERTRYEQTAKNWPTSSKAITAEIRSRGDRLQVIIKGLVSEPSNLSDIQLFPINPIVAPAGEQTWFWLEEKLIGNLQGSSSSETLPKISHAILVHPSGWNAIEGMQALALEISKSSDALLAGTGSGDPSAVNSSLWGLLLLAFVGGTILNLMPCVFPVLGLKIMGFVELAGGEKKKIVSHGLLFTAGVLVSFWILAGVLLGLRAGGSELGWGFQLQSPGFVFGMAAFLFLFALNLSGIFEIGFGLSAAGSRMEKGKGPWGSFFSGVLVTIVATPCSAPFLATALAGALTLPPLESFLTFTCIALGLAAPYLLLSLFPALLKILPKPGAWMETLKQLMAFPLYATVGWLVYVLAGQVEGDKLLNILLSLTLIALAVWIYGRYAKPHLAKTKRRIASLGAFILLAATLLYGYPKESQLQWIDWSPETVADLRENKRIVYVDFTARWCATCQVNKAVVFSSSEVLSFIEKNDVALVKADWTSEDPAITRRLTVLGKAAVPVNLVYLPTRDDPNILPETLTPGIVLKALRGE